MPEQPARKEMSSKLLSPIVTRKYVSAGGPQVPCQKQSGADPEPGAVAAVEYLSEEWVAGHRLGLQLDGKWTKHRCDHCGNFILGLLHAWHACRGEWAFHPNGIFCCSGQGRIQSPGRGGGASGKPVSASGCRKCWRRRCGWQNWCNESMFSYVSYM